VFFLFAILTSYTIFHSPIPPPYKHFFKIFFAQMTSSVIFPKTLGIFPVLKSTLGRYYSYSKPFFPISQKFAPYKHFFIFLFLRSRYRENWESGRTMARDPWSVIPVTITTQKSSNHHGTRLPNPIP